MQHDEFAGCAHCGGELITDDVGLCAQCINAGIEHPDDRKR